jgi:hypothetical protein
MTGPQTGPKVTTDYELLERAATLLAAAAEGAAALAELRSIAPQVRRVLEPEEGKKVPLWNGRRWADYLIRGGRLLPYREPESLSRAHFDRPLAPRGAPSANGCALPPGDHPHAGNGGDCPEEAPEEGPIVAPVGKTAVWVLSGDEEFIAKVKGTFEEIFGGLKATA